MNIKKESRNLISVLNNIFNKDEVFVVDGIDVSALYEFAKFHKLDHLLYTLVGKIEMSEDEKERIRNSHNLGLMVCAKQDLYAEIIHEELNRREIKHIFLKGSILKNLYPSPDMRQSSDIDILIEPERAKEIKVFMEELGFKTELFGTDQDVYTLDRMVNIEMHRTLLPDHSKWYEETEKMRQRAVLKDGFEYTLTDEDFYLFMIIHIAKHVSEGGIGIRSILDVWIYLKHCGKKLDMKVIEESLSRTELLKFEINIRNLCYHWFDNKESDAVTDELATYIFESGWNGREDVQKAIHATSDVKGNKFKYWLKYTFMSPQKLSKTFKILRKFPFLVPFVWIYRLFNAFFVRKGAVKSFIHRYDGIDEADMIERKELIKRVGL